MSRGTHYTHLSRVFIYNEQKTAQANGTLMKTGGRFGVKNAQVAVHVCSRLIGVVRVKKKNKKNVCISVFHFKIQSSLNASEVIMV